jgi:hypothetical protein
MRLKSEIWVKAYIRLCASSGRPAAVVRHGDDDAGAIYIRVNRLDGTSLIFGPSPAGLGLAAEDRRWMARLLPAGNLDAAIEAYLERELRSDPDIWIVEVEARDGEHLLGDYLISACP